MAKNIKSYKSIQGKFDPCPSIEKFYFTPPHLYIKFQKEGLKQYSPKEALKKGTLWPILYEYYETPYQSGGVSYSAD